MNTTQTARRKILDDSGVDARKVLAILFDRVSTNAPGRYIAYSSVDLGTIQAACDIVRSRDEATAERAKGKAEQAKIAEAERSSAEAKEATARVAAILAK